MSKTLRFQTVEYSISSLYGSIWPVVVAPYQVLPLRAWVDLGPMSIKRCSAFTEALALLEPHHQIVLSHIPDTRWKWLTPLQRCNRCILQPRPVPVLLHQWNLQYWRFLSPHCITCRICLRHLSDVRLCASLSFSFLLGLYVWIHFSFTLRRV